MNVAHMNKALISKSSQYSQNRRTANTQGRGWRLISCLIREARDFMSSLYSQWLTMTKSNKKTVHYCNIDDSSKKIVVVGDSGLPWRNNDGHVIMNILDFLMNPNSLELCLDDLAFYRVCTSVSRYDYCPLFMPLLCR